MPVSFCSPVDCKSDSGLDSRFVSESDFDSDFDIGLGLSIEFCFYFDVDVARLVRQNVVLRRFGASMFDFPIV